MSPAEGNDMSMDFDKTTRNRADEGSVKVNSTDETNENAKSKSNEYGSQENVQTKMAPVHTSESGERKNPFDTTEKIVQTFEEIFYKEALSSTSEGTEPARKEEFKKYFHKKPPNKRIELYRKV